MKFFAPAKLNLGLEVGARRADGFHEIDTILVRLSLADELEIETRTDGEIALTVAGDFALDVPPTENLVYRAAEKLRAAASRPELGATIHITKKIPHGAGLGGGSSDAATALAALNQLWRLNFPPEKLAEIAATLGSDVPFFLLPGAQRARGRGEILQAVALPPDLPQQVLLVVPPVRIATAEAYAWLDAARNPHNPPFKKCGDEALPSGRIFQNDFESVVFVRFPELAAARTELQKMGAVHAGLAGSGSVVFGIFTEIRLNHNLTKYGKILETEII